MKEKCSVLVLIMVTCAMLGEWKLAPFQTDFRFSFGAAAFFFFLLWYRGIHPLITGFSVGLFIVLFRSCLDALLRPEYFSVVDNFIHHLLALSYYVVFSLLFYLFKVLTWNSKPLILGFLGVWMDVISNVLEIAIRNHIFPTVQQLYIVLFIAIFRSYFVVGFITFLNYRQARRTEEKLKLQNEEMLLFISDLYAESMQLNNSLTHIENITRNGYEFYHKLKNSRAHQDGSAGQALRLVGQGILMYTRSKSDVTQPIFILDRHKLDIPIYVLMNKYSASDP